MVRWEKHHLNGQKRNRRQMPFRSGMVFRLSSTYTDLYKKYAAITMHYVKMHHVVTDMMIGWPAVILIRYHSYDLPDSQHG